jgi:hypothetical protein
MSEGNRIVSIPFISYTISIAWQLVNNLSSRSTGNVFLSITISRMLRFLFSMCWKYFLQKHRKLEDENDQCMRLCL